MSTVSSPTPPDPLRVAWIERYGPDDEPVILAGTALSLSPPDSPVALIGAAREGERLVAWGSWGFRLAAPTGDGVVVRVLDPSGSQLVERVVDR
jgi:hypothetical protein